MKLLKIILLLSLTFLLASCVEQSQASISIVTEDLTLEVGERFTLDVDINNPEDLYVYYRTSNRSIATVYFGEIIALSPGVVTISVELPGIYDSITLTVIETLNADTLAVVQMIDALDFPYQTVSVEAARQAYALLSNNDQARVRNYQKLLDSEQYLLDVMDADNVIEAINQFSNPLSKPEVGNARTLYNALTPAAKLLVSNYQVLLDAEQAILDAKIVNDLILAFSNPALASEITTARTAYDALSAAAKLLVIDYQDLVDAETAYNNQVAADAVISLIDGFSNPVTVNEAQAARDSYDLLTSDQKALVTNYQELLDAEALLVDQLAANTVKEMIDALETEYLQSDLTPIRTAYDLLTLEQQALVTNYQTFLYHEEAISTVELILLLSDPATQDEIDAAEEAYNMLSSVEQPYVYNYSDLEEAIAYRINIQYAQLIINAINNLPEEFLPSDLFQIRFDYNLLTDAQKLLVSNFQDLLDHEAAVLVVVSIINFSTPITSSELANAKAAYELLTDDQKALVYNYDVITDEEARLVDQAAADTVIALIEAFTDPLVEEDVTSARAAYNALTASQKLLVTNYSDLTDAEANFVSQLNRISQIEPIKPYKVISVNPVGDFDIFRGFIYNEQYNQTGVVSIFEGNTKLYSSNDFNIANPSIAYDDASIYFVEIESGVEKLYVIDITTKTKTLVDANATYQLGSVDLGLEGYFKFITRYDTVTKMLQYYDFDTSLFVNIGTLTTPFLSLAEIHYLLDINQNIEECYFCIFDPESPTDYIAVGFFDDRMVGGLLASHKLVFNRTTLKPMILDQVLIDGYMSYGPSATRTTYAMYNDLVVRISQGNLVTGTHTLKVYSFDSRTPILDRTFTNISVNQTEDGFQMIVQDYNDPNNRMIDLRRYDFYDVDMELINTVSDSAGRELRVDAEGRVFIVEMSGAMRIGFVDGSNTLTTIDMMVLADNNLFNTNPLPVDSVTAPLAQERFAPYIFMNTMDKAMHYFDALTSTVVAITNTTTELPVLYHEIGMETNKIVTYSPSHVGIIDLINNTYTSVFDTTGKQSDIFYLGTIETMHYYRIRITDMSTFLVDEYVLSTYDDFSGYTLTEVFTGVSNMQLMQFFTPSQYVKEIENNDYVYTGAAVVIFRTGLLSPVIYTPEDSIIPFNLNFDAFMYGTEQLISYEKTNANSEQVMVYCHGNVLDEASLICIEVPTNLRGEVLIIYEFVERRVGILSNNISEASSYNRFIEFISNISGRLAPYVPTDTLYAFIYGDKLVLLDDEYNETMTDFVVLDRFY